MPILPTGKSLLKNRGEKKVAEEFDEFNEAELTADEEALLKDLPELSESGKAGRKFLGQAATLGLGVFALNLMARSLE